MSIDIAKLASEIVTEYLQNDIHPTKTLVKIADRDGLNKNWIYRVAEVANVSLHQKIQEKMGSPMVEFDLADPRDATRKLADGERQKVKMASDEFNQVTEMEKGASIAAAEECVYYIQKKIEKNMANRPMEKTAAENIDPIIMVRAMSIKKLAKDFQSMVDGEITGTERKMVGIIGDIGTVVSRDIVYGNQGESLSLMRKAAETSFPDYKEGVNAIIDRIKEKVPSLSLIKESSVGKVDASFEKDSVIYKLFDSFIDHSCRYDKFKKIASQIVTLNLVRLPETEKEGQAILEKIALWGTSLKGGKNVAALFKNNKYSNTAKALENAAPEDKNPLPVTPPPPELPMAGS